MYTALQSCGQHQAVWVDKVPGGHQQCKATAGSSHTHSVASELAAKVMDFQSVNNKMRVSWQRWSSLPHSLGAILPPFVRFP